MSRELTFNPKLAIRRHITPASPHGATFLPSGPSILRLTPRARGRALRRARRIPAGAGRRARARPTPCPTAIASTGGLQLRFRRFEGNDSQPAVNQHRRPRPVQNALAAAVVVVAAVMVEHLAPSSSPVSFLARLVPHLSASKRCGGAVLGPPWSLPHGAAVGFRKHSASRT
jgi:hypothetical protein